MSLLSGWSTSGWVETSVWGSWAPLPTLATMTLSGVNGWGSPINLRDTFGEGGGWNFLKRDPPTPDLRELLLCQRRGRSGSLAYLHSARR